MVGDVADRLKELVYERAEMMGCKVITLEVMPDHVHLFIQGDPELTPNKIIGKIKGYTSHELRREFKELTTRLPTLWTWRYFISTHGHVLDKTIQKYIEEQKGV